jgi:dTDP-4-dehydrorhamnose 3,5-epimerase
VVFYKCSTFYNKESEGGIRFNDPQLNIDWQIPAGKEIISDKDRSLPLFAGCRNNFDFTN